MVFDESRRGQRHHARQSVDGAGNSSRLNQPANAIPSPQIPALTPALTTALTPDALASRILFPRNRAGSVTGTD